MLEVVIDERVAKCSKYSQNGYLNIDIDYKVINIIYFYGIFKNGLLVN